MDLWETIQHKALELVPVLSGDQLDRVSNLVIDQVETKAQVTYELVNEALNKVLWGGASRG